MDLDGESEEIMRSEEEMTRDRPSGASSANHNHYSKSKNNNESRRMVDITRDKPIKVAVRVVVPVRDHPKFNFVGKLLGPKGNSLKRLQEDTMCKMAVLGRGSMKDRHKEEELRASGDPKFQHLSEELHVEISAFATPAEAHARIAYALAEVRRFLVPDYNDDIRQEQMWEMQVLSQRNNGKSEDLNGPNSSTDCSNEDSHGAESMEGVPEYSGDDHPALRGIETESISTPPEATSDISGNSIQISPTNGVVTASNLGVPAGRKRPLLTGGPRTSMTPTKRTVMSLLARARAAQAKQMPATFQRGGAEFCVSDALPIDSNSFEKPSSPRKIIARTSSVSILERFEFVS